MAKTIVRGDDLMLFASDGKSIGFATNHTLTITGENVSTTSKDHGIFEGNKINKISWEITSENLYTADEYDALFDAMMKREAIFIYWGRKTPVEGEGTVADDDYQAWSINAQATASGASTTHVASYTADGTATGATNAYKGKVYITSLVSNAPTGDNATYSVTLKGTGKITRA